MTKIYGYIVGSYQRNLFIKLRREKYIYKEFIKDKYNPSYENLALALSNYMERQL